jgi:putative oxidoreductase
MMDTGLLVIRLGVGLMFLLVHGGPKLMGGPETWERVGGAMSVVGIGFAPVFWGFMAAASEGIGGLLLALGLFTRPAALLMTVTMAVASTMHLSHGDGLAKASHAIELGVVFLGLLMTGPGRYSLDQKWLGKRTRR